jgi:RNA polymerase sigma-32 factor
MKVQKPERAPRERKKQSKRKTAAADASGPAAESSLAGTIEPALVVEPEIVAVRAPSSRPARPVSIVVDGGMEILPPEPSGDGEAEGAPIVAKVGDAELLAAEEVEDLLPVPDEEPDDDASSIAPGRRNKKDRFEADVPERASGVVRYDALSAYLREIGRYKPLDRDEEHALAVRYTTEQDFEAAYKLVSSNLWLVVKIARDYERAARSIMDLIQEGNIGLMEAVKNFDPYKGTRFPSYAAWWVKAYIIRYVIANWRLVKLGTTQAQRKLFFNLKKEREKLERDGFYPSPKLLAEKLDVKESEVVEMEQRLGSADVSVDAPISDDGDSTLLSVLPDGQLSAEDILARKEMRDLVHESFEEFAATLNEKERVIFRERMLGEEKATLQDVAVRFSLSRERVRQIEERLREKLKDFLSKKLGPNMPTMDF